MTGTLHLILGPMFASKTTRIIAFVRQFKQKNIPVLVFKHNSDVRYSKKSEVVSHDKDTEECHLITSTSAILNHENYATTNVIIIEEAQFFDSNIVTDVKKMVNNDGKYVIVCGLSGDFKMEPFGHVYGLLCVADSIEMAKAYCHYCENLTEASFTLRTTDNVNQVEIGTDMYVPVCRKHYLEHYRA